MSDKDWENGFATGAGIVFVAMAIFVGIWHSSKHNDPHVGNLRPDTCYRVEYKITPPDELSSKFIRIPCPTAPPK